MPDVASLRAAWWTVRARRRARRDVRHEPFRPVSLPPPPPLPEHAARGVRAVLRRRSDTCLIRATVMQAWYSSQGQRRDVVIGVTAPKRGFRAHAWLDGDRAASSDVYEELIRIPAP